MEKWKNKVEVIQRRMCSKYMDKQIPTLCLQADDNDIPL